MAASSGSGMGASRCQLLLIPRQPRLGIHKQLAKHRVLDEPVPAKVIKLRGVRVHNLKNVDVDIPRGKLVAICGVSGSGKTSLALDTLYAEGQRRYIESFSAYTRQFLERIEKPEFDSIVGLPPALAVTRSAPARGNRSTVGTASETLDYLRLLFAKVSKLRCYQCGDPVESHTPQSVATLIESLGTDRRLMVAFQSTWEDVGDRASVLADLQASGFVRLLAGGQMLNLGQDQRTQMIDALPVSGAVWVIVDRLRGGDRAARTTESLENAFDHGRGDIGLLVEGDRDQQRQPADDRPEPSWTPLQIDDSRWSYAVFSNQRKCSNCSIDYPDPEPQLFSFNSPLGACSECEGFGDTVELDLDLVFPDRCKTIREGAIAPWSTPAYKLHLEELVEIAGALKIRIDVPVNKLRKREMKLLLAGKADIGFPGIVGFFASLERKKYKMHVRVFIARWRTYSRCASCHGARLSPVALSYRIDERSLAELCEMEIAELYRFLGSIDFSPRNKVVAAGPLEQVRARLGYLQSVGLGYLQLARPLRTLSGGEAQRTALTTALGSNLVNMLYVLDEPSAGLHPHQVAQLALAIDRLTARGNTVVIVEHEDLLLERADALIEVGPGAGSQGGEIVFHGGRDQIRESNSLTGDYLSGRRWLQVTKQKRSPKGSLRISGCARNNLKSINVVFPLGLLCVVTGVSGSGKSSLVQDTLYGAVTTRLKSRASKSTAARPAKDSQISSLEFESIVGTEEFDDCVLVDQSPVSRSPRSNPVTYVKAFDAIRRTFADTVDAKIRNFSAGHFSFNSDLGRCPTCSGDGVLEVDMQFLADVRMTCPECRGTRFRAEILVVKYRDQTIADVLNMTVRDASHFFRGASKVQQKLKVLCDVGLDYLQLGQSAATISSGEAQRLKLAGHLSKASQRRTLFLLDEPTIGLHPHDIGALLACFDALLAAGNSLVVVEHNLHLLAAADHIIDLGPGAADQGGEIVTVGTPEQVADCATSITGQYLKAFLSRAT